MEGPAWTFIPGYIHHQSGAAALYSALTSDQLQRLIFDYLYRTMYMGGSCHMKVTSSTREYDDREKWIGKIYAPESTMLNNVENEGRYTDVHYMMGLTVTLWSEEIIN